MKRIISLVLALVLLVSAFAVLPVAAGNTAEDGVYVYLDEGFHIVFVTDGEETSVAVAAKEMADYKTNGTYTVSLQDYAKELIADGGEKASTVNLLSAMLGYGRAAADYFNYVFFDPDEGSIVIDGTPVTDTADLLAAEAPEATYTDDAGIYIGATLILEGTMKLRFYFAGTDITATVDGVAATATAADGYSYVDVAVMPYDMAKAVTVQAGATTVTYAPINYLKNKATDATLSTMVASIYAYGVAAENYRRVSGCDHEGIVLDVVTPATLLNDGAKEGVCPKCETTIVERIARTTPITNTFTEDTSNKWISESVNVYGLLDEGQKFYPTADDPEGNDLYVEFSFLWNESLENSKNGASNDYFYFGSLGLEDASDTKNIFYLLMRDDVDSMFCKYAGGFETTNSDYIDFGPSIADPSKGYVDKLDFPFIGEYGWHRIGIQYHQHVNPAGASNAGKSDLEVTLYVDGVKVSTYDTYKTTSKGTYALFKAWVSGDSLAYADSDVKSTMCVLPLWLGDCRAKDGTEMNVSYADLIVSAGKGFKMNVNPVTDATVDADLNEKVFYEISDDEFCAHSGTEYTVARKATTALPGLKSGVCPDCGKTVTYTYNGTTTDYWNVNPNAGSKAAKESYKVVDVLKGDHFYPTPENPEGNDLLVEWTFTWYEGCLANLISGSKGDKMLLASIGDEGGTTSSERSTPFFIIARDGASSMWCRFEGGFETDSNGSAIIYGPKNPDNTGNKADYAFIGGEGAHRIGVRIHQDAEIVDNEVKYTCIAYLYLDGVMISSFYFTPKDKNRLYTAEIVGNELVYSDIGSDRYVHAFLIDERQAASGTNYLLDADIFVTCGKDFVMQVEPIENPTTEYCYVKNKKIPSTPHFRVVTE